MRKSGEKVEKNKMGLGFFLLCCCFVVAVLLLMILFSFLPLGMCLSVFEFKTEFHKVGTSSCSSLLESVKAHQRLISGRLQRENQVAVWVADFRMCR